MKYLQIKGIPGCHQGLRTSASIGRVSSIPLLGTTQIWDFLSLLVRGRLTTHGAPRAIGDHGALCPCPNSKKLMKKVPGASHGAPY
ncbi:unnamed protein product [Staurois parvus]|uniref:Uncharacterized protein n=1 Tax=Staurois parvus TaxID=386267 RepID=A0ABN9F8X7_9NEOB|nr:unnamed protein product [Staurois parvus]